MSVFDALFFGLLPLTGLAILISILHPLFSAAKYATSHACIIYHSNFIQTDLVDASEWRKF
jgi:hypothetical protein